MGFLKKTVPIFVILIVFFVFRNFLLDRRENVMSRNMEIYFEVSYKGLITDKFIDEFEHNKPYIKFKNSKQEIPKNIYDKLIINDSVVKNSNTFKITVYRMNNEVIILSYSSLE